MSYMGFEVVDISSLKGKIFSRVFIDENENLCFHSNSEWYRLTNPSYDDGLYVSFCVKDLVGDLNDLVGEPIIISESVNVISSEEEGNTYTCTFYKFATRKGYVDISFNVTSDYYTEEVILVKDKIRLPH